MKKSCTLLATILRCDPLSRLCISNYTYIARNNNIYYDHHNFYTLSNIFQTEYNTILCMNNFCIFVHKHIQKLLDLLDSSINLILPTFTNMPIDMLPFYIRKCDWSQKFIDLYIQSKNYNVQSFINDFKYYNDSRILYTDLIGFDNHSTNNNTIIKQLSLLPIKSCIETIKHYNMLLGII
jgi:hypothetical protein